MHMTKSTQIEIARQRSADRRRLTEEYNDHTERLWNLYLDDIISKVEFLARRDTLFEHYNKQLIEKYGVNYAITNSRY